MRRFKKIREIKCNSGISAFAAGATRGRGTGLSMCRAPRFRWSGACFDIDSQNDLMCRSGAKLGESNQKTAGNYSTCGFVEKWPLTCASSNQKNAGIRLLLSVFRFNSARFSDVSGVIRHGCASR